MVSAEAFGTASRCFFSHLVVCSMMRFHFLFLLCLQKNNEMSNELVVEAEDSAPMSEVCSRTQMDAIEELQEEEEEQE